jgi:hypothetical protein
MMKRLHKKRSKFICQACRKKIKAGVRVFNKGKSYVLCPACFNFFQITGKIEVTRDE